MLVRNARKKPHIFAAAMLLCLLLGTGCRTQQDAVAAATQMAATAATMSAYYSSLDMLTVRLEDAERAQFAINGTPFGKEDMATLEERRAELRKRADLAAALARLSAIFSSISNSSAPSDAADAAGKLNDQLVAMKALTQNDAEAQGLKAAVNAMVALVRSHDEVKAARSIAPVSQAMAAFFHSEKPLYVSVTNEYYRVARSNAKYLVQHDQVLTHSLYDSSLEPFGLQPAITAPELKGNLQEYLLAQVDARFADRTQDTQHAADDLDAALVEMQHRIELVAADHPMHATLPPATLEGVKQWIVEVKADLGV